MLKNNPEVVKNVKLDVLLVTDLLSLVTNVLKDSF